MAITIHKTTLRVNLSADTNSADLEEYHVFKRAAVVALLQIKYLVASGIPPEHWDISTVGRPEAWMVTEKREGQRAPDLNFVCDSAIV